MKLRRWTSAAAVLFLFACACAPQQSAAQNGGSGPDNVTQDSGTQDNGPQDSETQTPQDEEGKQDEDSAAQDSLRLTAEEEKIAVFTAGASPLFSKRSGRNGDPFNCTFLPDNVRFGAGEMQLFLTETQNGYGGSEYRSNAYYSYGFYSVSMKAANCPGVISSFFTYTGRPWDEIDIEFLGKNTREIQFNYYTKGQGGHEFVYSLGFDGAADFHEYAFLWLPTSITWYVDGKAVHTAEAPTQIMMNVWNCKGNDAWSGTFDEKLLPACASYQWIGYSPYAAEQ